MSAASLPRRRTAPPLAAAGRGLAVAAPRAALAGIAAVAALLRFNDLGAMSVNPFYDAAVRSMGSSWHAFLVGAFNPNASVAVDKPPLDLWLQVASTKVFGFSAFALHLPEALASTAAVLLLYGLVRRGFGRAAGLAAAAALAVLPAEVMTARSDTMDASMAALLLLAAWLIVRALERGRARELYLAGAVVGLAFETKLFEALVPLPALALMFLLGSNERIRTRIRQLAGAGTAMVAVGLAWPLLFALMQAGGRPYPLGSSDGSIWSTVFVFNGIGRVSGNSTRSALDRLSPPGAGRLVAGGPIHLDALVGTTLVATLAIAVAALALGLVRRRSLGRLPFALAIGMGVWLISSSALVSFMSHVPVRYLEVLTPALAGTFGIAVALGAQAAVRSDLRRTRAWISMIAASIALAAATAGALLFANGVAPLPVAALVAAVCAAGVLTAGRRLRLPLAGLVTALVAVALLAAPASQSLTLVGAHRGDGGALGAMPPHTVAALSRYLTRHQGDARYEVAALEAHQAGPLIVADARPVLILAGTPYHPLLAPQGLAAAVRAGRVHYVLVSSGVSSHPVHASARASTARGQMPAWVRTHGVDVSRQAGLAGYGSLYLLTPQTVRAG
jgi:4-amino-4-deoxy-L-arabinose transferase-like glycosyltransferase